MTIRYELETTHRIYDNNEGVCIAIARHPDDIDNKWFRIYTPDDGSSKFYGKIDLSLTKDQMRLLAEAITKVISDEKVIK